ncbi:MAG TPA: winged helix-turn-helix domain-containing protein [Cerasibacillus sp.]|uniref:winged helix-turn-helix domain-containing protein n=1 Tax=Cerasibacillus sp. TaxID=2498711 RepID=UPI002F4121AF
MLEINERWTLDTRRGLLINGENIVSLSRINFRIIYYLATRRNQPVSIENIIQFAWGNKNYATKNTLYVYIYRLRFIIEEDVKSPKSILNVRNYGYVLTNKF